MIAQSGALPRCATCGVEIARRPVFHAGGWFCCAGCAQKEPCHCGWDLPAARAELLLAAGPSARAAHRARRVPFETPGGGARRPA